MGQLLKRSSIFENRSVRTTDGRACSKTGVRVFIVEDEPLISLDVSDMANELGCVVAGTASWVADALQKARQLTFDLAVLDLDLTGQRVDPVAEIIMVRGLAIVVATGHETSRIATGLKGWPVIKKPFDTQQLGSAMQGALRVAPVRMSTEAPHG